MAVRTETGTGYTFFVLKSHCPAVAVYPGVSTVPAIVVYRKLIYSGVATLRGDPGEITVYAPSNRHFCLFTLENLATRSIYFTSACGV